MIPLRNWTKSLLSLSLAGAMVVAPLAEMLRLDAAGLDGRAFAQVSPSVTQSRGEPQAVPGGVFGDAYAACRVQSDAEFQAQLTKLIRSSLKRGVAKINYGTFVERQWRAQDIDVIIDDQVDRAINQVKNESSWADLIKSIGSKQKAKELAQAVADRAYQSVAFKSAVEDLTIKVAKEAGGELEFATEDAAKPAMQCVQAFLGPRYGSAVAKFVSQDTRTQFDPDKIAPAAKVGRGDQIVNSGEAIAGAVILLVRRSMARMARRVGQRVVGVVLGRVVSVVAGGVGVVLIAKDLWDFRNGVLPIISSEMKSGDTKAKIKSELASTLSSQMTTQVDDLAGETAKRIVEIWQGFRKTHTKVVNLTEQHPVFKEFMEGVGRSDVSRLDRIVGLVLAEEGEDALLKRVRNGTLDRAVKRLSDAGVEIAVQTKSVDAAFGWSDLAGQRLEDVVDFEVYRMAKPADFTKDSLRTLLQVNDKVAIVKMTGLPAETRATLLTFEPEALRTLGRRFEADELAALAKYMNGLQPDVRTRLVQIAKASPAKFRPLAITGVQRAVLASADQNAALDFMLRPPSIFDFASVWSDAQQVVNGKISPVLLWHKQPAAVTVALALTFIVVLLFYRLLFGRRPKVIVKNVSS